MSHLLFDSLAGVTVDNQTTVTVQSLLDTQSLSSEGLPGATVVVSRPPNTITLDEEDVFQCGKCKKQFTSFCLFMNHKKAHAVSGEQLAGSPVKEQGSLALSLDRGQSEGDERGGNAYAPTLQECETEVGQPIILSDTDILNFSIDHGALNLSTGSHVLPSLSHVIQTGTFLTSPVEASSSLKSLSGVGTGSNLNVTTLEGQPIILTEGSFAAAGDIQQEQQQQAETELSNGSSKIVEYCSSTEAKLEFLDAATGTVEFTTQDIITQHPQSATGDAELLLSTIVEPQTPQPVKAEDNSDSQHTATKTLKLKCKYCSKQFAKNFDMQQHLRSHTGEKPFQCVVCGRAFAQKSNVKKHMATHKVWPHGLNQTLPKEPIQPVAKRDAGTGTSDKDSDPEVELMVDRAYVCQYCSTRFESYFELKTHMKLHSHQKVYKCIQKNCQQTFSDLDTFVTHTQVHSSEVLYRCHVCSKQFHTLADVGIHQYSHNAKTAPPKVGSRSYRCVKCKSKFSSPESLDHHMAVSTHSYPCVHCGKVFACERYLRRHLPTHGTSHSFTCQQCGKGFRTEQYLNTHMLTHSSHKPFVCQHCPRAFNRKDKLVRHVLIHQTVKKFKCPFRSYLGCPKEFNRQDKLKLHILTHSSVRPSLQCRICNKTFQRQTQLRQHDRTHHQVALHTCQHCGMGFKKKMSLTAHECNSSREQVDGNCVMQENNPQQTEVGSRLQNVARRGIRKAKLRGRSKRDLQLEESIKTGDNVPTIEIIVMPVPVSLDQHAAGDGSTSGVSACERGGMYHVVFPADSKMQSVFQTQEEAALNQCNQQQDQEVPVTSTTS